MDLSSAFSLPAIPVQPVEDPVLSDAGITLSVLRLDLVHPEISGNKWFKLKYNLLAAREAGQDTLLSFGGPWSNHLHALAAAGRDFGFRTIGIVRGELPSPLTPCLEDARAAGMALHGITRSRYADREAPPFLAALHEEFGQFHLIPEGGANREGLQGCAEITALYSQKSFDRACMACGTGTMLAGMASTSRVPLLGFQVLKGRGYLEKAVESHFSRFGLRPACPWAMEEGFHGGGYARVSRELLRFLTDFRERHGIPLEPVYSGKLLYGIFECVKKRDIFPQNSRILAIHGGGLQGLRGFL